MKENCQIIRNLSFEIVYLQRGRILVLKILRCKNDKSSYKDISANYGNCKAMGHSYMLSQQT
jgi:hypothetical protein